jgi:ATP-binding cassette subfamily F protein uup
VGIVGRNGTGKTTLLRAILGEHEVQAGRLSVGKNTTIAYLSQMRDGLDDEASVRVNVAGERGNVRIGGQDLHIRGYLERFLFRGTEQEQPVGSLSGGERTRVALAKLLQQASNLLILDEPTNDLDVETLASIESLILESEQTALVVTHDRWFLDSIATAVLFLEGDQKAVRYEGGYSEAREQRDAARKLAARSKVAPEKVSASGKSGTESQGKTVKKGLSYKETRELEGLEGVIEELEAEMASLDEQLGDPSLYQGGGTEAADLGQRRDAVELAIETKMNRWAELEERKSL